LFHILFWYGLLLSKWLTGSTTLGSLVAKDGGKKVGKSAVTAQEVFKININLLIAAAAGPTLGEPIREIESIRNAAHLLITLVVAA
jgi:hypothetical protein